MVSERRGLGHTRARLFMVTNRSFFERVPAETCFACAFPVPARSIYGWPVLPLLLLVVPWALSPLKCFTIEVILAEDRLVIFAGRHVPVSLRITTLAVPERIFTRSLLSVCADLCEEGPSN